MNESKQEIFWYFKKNGFQETKKQLTQEYKNAIKYLEELQCLK